MRQGNAVPRVEYGQGLCHMPFGAWGGGLDRAAIVLVCGTPKEPRCLPLRVAHW